MSLLDALLQSKNSAKYESSCEKASPSSPSSPSAVRRTNVVEGKNAHIETPGAARNAHAARTDTSKAIESEIQAQRTPMIFEATFRRTTDNADPGLAKVSFPECPECGAIRFWISGGLMRCGSKVCASAPRFVLVALQFHPVN